MKAWQGPPLTSLRQRTQSWDFGEMKRWESSTIGWSMRKTESWSEKSWWVQFWNLPLKTFTSLWWQIQSFSVTLWLQILRSKRTSTPNSTRTAVGTLKSRRSSTGFSKSTITMKTTSKWISCSSTTLCSIWWRCTESFVSLWVMPYSSVMVAPASNLSQNLLLSQQSTSSSPSL